MYTHKTVRFFLASILLASVSFSSLVISPVQADTTSSVTLSPTVIAKLDAFIVKVQALRTKYPSDTNWNTFLTNLNTKIGALKPQYTGNALILAVLDRLSSGVNGIKSGIVENTTIVSDTTDLCAQQGLNNIDETNFSVANNVVKSGAYGSFGNSLNNIHLAYAYKMNSGESYSFPGYYYTQPNYDTLNYFATNSYVRSPTYVVKLSEKKCDFSYQPKDYKIITGATTDRTVTDDPCIGIGHGGSGVWDIRTSKLGHKDRNLLTCHLDPTKKYYLNVRWLKKSDVFDSAGNVLTPATSPIGTLISRFTSYSGLSPESLEFNSNGNVCLNSPDHPCVITMKTDGDFGNKAMPLLTAERQQEIMKQRANGAVCEVGPCN